MSAFSGGLTAREQSPVATDVEEDDATLSCQPEGAKSTKKGLSGFIKSFLADTGGGGFLWGPTRPLEMDQLAVINTYKCFFCATHCFRRRILAGVSRDTLYMGKFTRPRF